MALTARPVPATTPKAGFLPGGIDHGRSCKVWDNVVFDEEGLAAASSQLTCSTTPRSPVPRSPASRSAVPRSPAPRSQVPTPRSPAPRSPLSPIVSHSAFEQRPRSSHEDANSLESGASTSASDVPSRPPTDPSTPTTFSRLCSPAAKILNRLAVEDKTEDEDLTRTMVQAFNAEEEEVEEEDQGQHSPTQRPSPMYMSTEARWEAEVKQLVSGGLYEEAASRVAPASFVRSYVKRTKNSFGVQYELHLENEDVRLMTAQKQGMGSTHHISTASQDQLQHSSPKDCVAKLKSNFVGDEYMVWGKSADKRVKKGYAAEDMCIQYSKSTATSWGGPRLMHVAVAKPSEEPRSEHGVDDLGSVLHQAKAKALSPAVEEKVVLLCTRPLKFNEELKVFTMEFHGKAKQQSVKNFQLVQWNHNTDCPGSDLVLQFGKVQEDVYELDFTYPFTAKTAFAAALASLDTKLCYAV